MSARRKGHKTKQHEIAALFRAIEALSEDMANDELGRQACWTTE